VTYVSQVERYAVDIWNSVVKKHAGRNLMAVANAKCKLNIIMLLVLASNGTNLSGTMMYGG